MKIEGIFVRKCGNCGNLFTSGWSCYPKKKDGNRVKGYDTTYHRLFWDKPAATITKWNGIMGSQNNVHPGRFWKNDENGDPMYTNPRVLNMIRLRDWKCWMKNIINSLIRIM